TLQIPCTKNNFVKHNVQTEGGETKARMKLLASRIALEVRTHGHCGVYEEELALFWPISDEDRERKIRQFARENGFGLRFYKKGLCAIFDKDSANRACATD